jgi:hypothetical protein
MRRLRGLLCSTPMCFIGVVLQVMTVWYLQGWAWHLRGDGDHALEALYKARDLFAKNACEEQSILQHIEELLASYPPQEVHDE